MSSVAPESVAVGQRGDLLGGGWAQSSDRAVTTSGDATGFHVLVADARDGYQWRTAASLSEPGFDADAWIGNICVTASGRRAVVVYAPRTFTNKPELADRGGFGAIVDLDRGEVRKLPIQTSLAYFNPGCGPTESAVLSQGGGADLTATRLFELDVASGSLGKPIVVPGQLTSPVPTARGIVAADSGALVRVDATGGRTVLAPAKGVPFRVTADADGGVVFLQREGTGGSAVVRAAVPERGRGATTTLATGALTELSVRAGRGGQVFVTGTKTPTAASTPPSVAFANVPDDAEMSLSGEVAVTRVARTRGKDPRVPVGDPLVPQQVDISAVSRRTNKSFTLSAVPAGSDGAQASPALAVSVGPGVTAGDPNDPADGDQRYCAVARNDPRNQAMQPKPRQVEWAVNQAVLGVLTVQRPANWKNLGMDAYTPQGMFPPTALSGGGTVPAQVMLGILAQESNMWQAARFAIPGMTANPLIGNYFGINYYNQQDPGGEADDWTINWAKADCGYGVAQITDGMRLPGKGKEGELPLPYAKQRAIALDFAANVAKGVEMLQTKWNQTRAAGLFINNGAHDRIENWFFAVWAYNSGFYPDKGNGEPWGVGWLNNPVNPRYPAERDAFLDKTYTDAAHPQHWPYPEKVMGWAGHPIELIESPGKLVHGYLASWWLSDIDRTEVKPPVAQFCDASNQCIPGAEIKPTDPDVKDEPAGPCAHKNNAGLYDLKCWYRASSTWKPDCQDTCGRGRIRFDAGYAYQEDGASHAPNCGFDGMPANALIVDNLPTSVPSIRPNCPKAFTNAGSFRFSFTPLGGNYPGKIDVHQIGSGYGAQFWMSNTMKEPTRKAVGTWTLDRAVGPWARVLVHLPVIGARTQQARYEIDVNGDGTYSKHRYLPQETRRNGWVSLGAFNFKGVPSIRLSNITDEGRGTDRIAWDAIAVQPLPGKPKHIVAALGDSYSSGEGAGNYLVESDVNHGTPLWNACRRSREAYPRKVVLFGSGDTLGALVDRFDPHHELGFVACSGADTGNVGGWGNPPSWNYPDEYQLGDGQFREIGQLQSGVLDEHTTLVTLTVGGNDGDAFAKAMAECGDPASCARDDTFLPRYKSLIDTAKARIDLLLREIHRKAPNAKIVLLGYPEVFSRTVKCVGSWYYDMLEVQALAELAGYLNTKQDEITQTLRTLGIPAHSVSAVNGFAGHGGCDQVEWIHKFMAGPYGEGDFHKGDKASPFCFWDIAGGACLSRSSFHPNGLGTAAYAQILRTKLDGIGYTGG